MPSLPVRIASFLLGTTGVVRKRFTAGPDFRDMIAKVQALPLAEPTAAMKRRFAVSHSVYGSRPVWSMAPKGGTASAHILFWHGGGYVFPITPLHWKFLAHMVGNFGWSVTVPYYPLAPDSDARTTTDWTLGFYDQYIAEQRNGPIAMAGDSAGGGLTAATAMLARDGGLALPDKLILICPWLALDPSHSDQLRIEPRDVILSLSGIQEAGRLYAGALHVSEARCSPIAGSWHGLPPILAFGGGNDILVPDARALKAHLPTIEYSEIAGMMHDWPIFPFSESRQAQAQMAAFTAHAIP
jgi:epsilon-lactone hydrolase